MAGAMMFLFGSILFAAGLLVGATAERHLNQMRDNGPLDKNAAKRYRAAARIMHDLLYVDDLSTPNIPTLPGAIKSRIEAWLTSHNESIQKGK